MADNKDDNNTSEELPLDGGGDIEQGGSTNIPENTDSVWSSEAAAITTPPSKWTLGGLEEVEEDAAPVPLVQQIAGMGIEKDDITASGSASLPRLPAQDVRPTVMEEDSQRPKPSYDSAAFESNADDQFNRRLLAKAAMAADLKGETKRPTFTFTEDDSSRRAPSSDSAAFASNADNQFNRRLLAKAATAAASKGETKRPTVMEDDSSRRTPSSDSAAFESNADDQFNRRLLAKAATAADLKGETKRPTFTFTEDDSSRPTSSSDSAAFASNADDQFNRRLLAKAATAAASKGEDARPPVADDDSQSRRFDSTHFGDEGSKKITAAPQLPIQHAMKQIEDGDDAAPRPFNSAELVSSSSNGQTEAAGGVATSSIDDNGSIGEDPVVQQMIEHPSPGDEENNLQRLVEPASDEMRQVVPPAAERYPSLPILEAYLVEEEEGSDDAPPLTATVANLAPGGRDTVYEATPVEPELPWWKQKRIKMLLMIICILMIALAAGVGAVFSRPIPIAENVPIAEIDNNNNTSTSTSNATPTAPPNSLPPTQTPTKPSIPIAEADNSNDDNNTADATAATFPTAPPNRLPPTQPPTKPSYACFADRNELKTLVDRYVRDGCGISTTLCTDISNTYGWPIGSWCVDDVTNMASLFEGLAFDEDISGWRVGQVTDMSRMFADAGMFKRDLSSWNMSSVTSTREMFKGATSFNKNLCAWKDNFSYSNANDIFVDSGCTYKLDPSSSYQGPFCASTCNTVTAADCFTTRDELKAAVDQYVQGDWDAADSFKYGLTIGSWCVGSVTDMSELFKDLGEFNEDISQWEVGQVTDMEDMFRGASSFNQDLSRWNTSAVTTMKSMFWGASAFNGDISSWNTSAVTDMSWMFIRASSFNQEDLSNWDTSAVTTMYAMFDEASAFNGNIASWNTSAVTDMLYMFYKASSFNQNLCSWKDDFPYDFAYAIFTDSGCTYQGEPQVEQQGPFCASSCT